MLGHALYSIICTRHLHSRYREGVETQNIPDPQPLIVGAALMDSLAHPARLLAARRTSPAALAGLWEFPGGKVEPSERPEAALLRELREELGVGAELGPELLAPESSGWLVSGGARMRVWFATVVSGAPEPLQDHDELRWLGLGSAGGAETVLKLPWIPADLPIVAELLRQVGHG